MGKIPAGQAEFRLTAKDDTGATLDKTASKFSKIGSKFKSVGAGIGTATKMAAVGMAGLATAGIGAAAGAVAVGKSWADEADRIAKASRVLGIGIESLQELEYAGRANGISAQKMGNMVSRSYRRMGNAAKEGGPAKRAMEALGISADELSKKTPEEAFYGLLSSLSSVEDTAFRNQLAFETLGDEWKAMAPILDGGTQVLDDARKRFQELNLGMSETEVLAGEELAQSFSDLGDSFAMVKNSIGAAVAGPLTKFNKWLAESIGLAKRFIDNMGGIGNTLASVWDVGLLSIQVSVVEAYNFITSVFEDLAAFVVEVTGKGLTQARDLYHKFYADGVFNWLVTKLGEMNGVKTIGGGNMAASGRDDTPVFDGLAAEMRKNSEADRAARDSALMSLRQQLESAVNTVATAVDDAVEEQKKAADQSLTDDASDSKVKAPDVAAAAKGLATNSTILTGFALAGAGAVMSNSVEDKQLDVAKKQLDQQKKMNANLTDAQRVK